MHFKLLLVFIDDERTDAVLQAARKAGATGSTCINNARGEGLEKSHGIFGMELTAARDVLLLLVEEHRAHDIMQIIGEVGHLDDSPGTGLVLQLDVDKVLGISRHVAHLIQTMHNDSP